MGYKISIIIPIYNAEDCLYECIDSLINQSFDFKNIEVILVDDVSTDNSRDIMENLSNKYNNIKTFYLNENSGTASEPRNIGIQNATAEYIMFLDNDDYYYPEMCEVMYNTITKQDCDVVSCRYTMGDKTNNSKVKNYFFDKKEEIINIENPWDYPDVMSLGFTTMIWTKIFKRDLIIDNNLKFPKGELYEDVYFSAKYYLYSKKIILLNNFYGYNYHVRREGENISFSQEFSQNSFLKQYYGFKKVINEIPDEFTKLKSEIIIDMTKLFIYSKLDEDTQNNFLEYMKKLYKEYPLTIRIGTANIFINMIINVFIKLFSINTNFTKLIAKLYQKI